MLQKKKREHSEWYNPHKIKETEDGLITRENSWDDWDNIHTTIKAEEMLESKALV